MALRQSYSASAEVPDALREHYVEKEGRWLLQTDPPSEDVGGLKSALEKERTLRRDGEKELTNLKVKFEGIEPDEVTKLRERVRGLDDSEVYDKQGIEALVTKRTQTMKDEHARVLSVKDRENAQLKDTNASLDTRWRADRIKTALLDAATKAGVAKHALSDAVARGMSVFVALDDDGVPIAKNGEDVRYGKDGVKPLSPDEWIASLKPDAPHLWPTSSGGGAGGHQNGTGTGGVDYTKIASPTERLTAFRQAQGT